MVDKAGDAEDVVIAGEERDVGDKRVAGEEREVGRDIDLLHDCLLL